MKSTKYGITSLHRQFPNDDAILDFIFKARHTEQCSCGGTYKRIKGRKQYQCSKCRYQIAPLAGTIFHKSDTPLTLWFHAIMVFSNAKSGMSGKALERDLEITYKTAWRMLHLIRTALEQAGDKLSGDVEVDVGYFGGVYRSGKYNERQKDAIADKSVVVAAIQRKGGARAKVVSDAKSEATTRFIQENIAAENTRLMTDKSPVYFQAGKTHDRHSVDHHRKEYVRGDIYVNSVEAFWAHVKRSIKGTHKVVSKQHLQEYLNGFVWHHSNRYNDNERFASLLGTLLQPAK